MIQMDVNQKIIGWYPFNLNYISYESINIRKHWINNLSPLHLFNDLEYVTKKVEIMTPLNNIGIDFQILIAMRVL